MSFVVFPAGPADAEDLARVHVTSWRETYRGLLPDAYLNQMSEAAFARRWRRTLRDPRPNDATLVAADHGGLIGYAGCGPSRRAGERTGEIATLYVLRAAQRQGVGRALITAAARVLAGNGARGLTISVLRDNFAARAFYEHLGGVADPPRAEPGPGGLLQEVAYVWSDIRAVIS
jgi:ribosomal protein S18 acetylase RimI-like enzyme